MRILLIGGDPELVQLAMAQGYGLVQVADADEAISHALQSAAFDVVITNHAMPDANAATLLREMGRMLPKARLALVSDHVFEDLDYPRIQRLPKPLMGDQLVEILRAAKTDRDPSRATA